LLCSIDAATSKSGAVLNNKKFYRTSAVSAASERSDFRPVEKRSGCSRDQIGNSWL
jgi:hypothetical protein